MINDGYRSRKWWGMLLTMALLTWGARHVRPEIIEIWMPAIITAYGTFCGLNIAEKVIGSGGLLTGLGLTRRGRGGDDQSGDREVA